MEEKLCWLFLTAGPEGTWWGLQKHDIRGNFHSQASLSAEKFCWEHCSVMGYVGEQRDISPALGCFETDVLIEGEVCMVGRFSSVTRELHLLNVCCCGDPSSGVYPGSTDWLPTNATWQNWWDVTSETRVQKALAFIFLALVSVTCLLVLMGANSHVWASPSEAHVAEN